MAMKDVNIQTPGGLSAAEDAVCYLLKRLRHDADIRWLMVGTESYHRLCAAEAQRTGQDVEAVQDQYAQAHPYCRNELPRVKQLQAQIDKLERGEAMDMEAFDAAVDDRLETIRAAIQDALDLCPACVGLPETSINRCEMCRKLAGVI